jgi:hypothetical protein
VRNIRLNCRSSLRKGEPNSGRDVAAPWPGLLRRARGAGEEAELRGADGTQSAQYVAIALQLDAELLADLICPVLGHALIRAGDRQLAADRRTRRLVGAEALLGDLAVDQGVAEAGGVSRGAPDVGMHDDRGVDADDVLARGDHVPPPFAHQVALELGAERAVVIGRLQAAVDLRGLEDESPALAQGHQLLHHLGGSLGSR